MSLKDKPENWAIAANDGPKNFVIKNDNSYFRGTPYTLPWTNIEQATRYTKSHAEMILASWVSRKPVYLLRDCANSEIKEIA